MDTASLKAALLAAPPVVNRKDYVIELDNGENVPVRVESPTMKVWGQIANRSLGEDGEMDAMKMAIWGVILLCKNPDNGEAIFNVTDYPALENMPFAGWFAELSKHVSEIFNAEEADREVGNESETTPASEQPST